MTDLTTATDIGVVAPTDRVVIIRNGAAAVVTVQELSATFLSAVTLGPGNLLGRPGNGSGPPQPMPLAPGLAVAGGALAPTAADHLTLPPLLHFDLNAEVIVNSAGAPARLSFFLMLAFLSGALQAGGVNMAGVPVIPLLSGSLSDASTAVTGTGWTSVTVANANRQALLIQNRGLVDVELSIGGTAPTNQPGTATPGAILLEARGIFPPPGMSFVCIDTIWARCANTADASVLTVKLG